jgi:hypothetical protein
MIRVQFYTLDVPKEMRSGYQVHRSDEGSCLQVRSMVTGQTSNEFDTLVAYTSDRSCIDFRISQLQGGLILGDCAICGARECSSCENWECQVASRIECPLDQGVSS